MHDQFVWKEEEPGTEVLAGLRVGGGLSFDTLDELRAIRPTQLDLSADDIAEPERFGARAELVGPGEAYQHWRKTDAYQAWSETVLAELKR